MLRHHGGVAGLAPDALVDHVAVEDLPRSAGEEGHDVEVLAREGGDALAMPASVGRDTDLAAREVHDDASRESHRRPVEAPVLACELRPHPGAEDLEREGLCHVVVAARGEAGDRVGVLDAGGEEDDGAGHELADRAAHRESVGVRQVDVEEYRVGRPARRLDRARGVARHERAVPLEPEVRLEHVRDVSLVVHYENEGRVPVPLARHVHDPSRRTRSPSMLAGHGQAILNSCRGRRLRERCLPDISVRPLISICRRVNRDRGRWRRGREERSRGRG